MSKSIKEEGRPFRAKKKHLSLHDPIQIEKFRAELTRNLQHSYESREVKILSSVQEKYNIIVKAIEDTSVIILGSVL